MNMKSYVNIAVVVCTVAIVAGVSAAFSLRGVDDNPVAIPGGQVFTGNRLSEEHKTYWRSVIETTEGPDSWELFQQTFAAESSGRQHELAHIFGGLLYEEKGLPGVSVCDNNFSFGCYHEFLGRAISEYGMDVVASLNERCRDRLKEQALGCQHGIGHGIASAVGYEEDDLITSLRVCDSLPIYDPIGGCKGGVFMEYNFRTTLAPEVPPREYKEEQGLYWPCDKLDKEHLPACYYWQAQWWDNLLRLGMAATRDPHTLIGEWCGGITDQSQRIWCYRGVGNILPGSVGWKIEAVADACNAMPNRFGIVNCTGAAVASLSATPELREQAPSLCEGLPETERGECRQIGLLFGTATTTVE